MAKSIAEQVAEYLTKHPETDNQELYAAFPQVRSNTLRHYKSKFQGPQASNKANPKAKTAPTTPGKKATKAHSQANAAAAKSAKPKNDLEKRLAKLEKEVNRLGQLIENKHPFKDMLSQTTGTLDKVLKDLEENLGNLKAKVQGNYMNDLRLEELQQMITQRVSQFVQSLKKGGKP